MQITLKNYESLFLEGRYDELVSEINTLQDKTNHYYTILALAKVLYGKLRFAEAIGLLVECLKINPEDTEPLLYFGLCYSSMGIEKEAYRLLLAYIHSNNNHYIDVYHELAKICFYVKKDYIKASNFYEKALHANPSKADLINYHLGHINLAFGHYEKALSHFKKCHRTERQEDLLYSLAICSVFLDNLKDALMYLTKLKEQFGNLYGSDHLYNELITKGTNRGVMDFFHSTNSSTLDNNYASMLNKFIKETLPLLDIFRDNWPLTAYFNELDGILLYYLIRELKPKNVIEFAPYRGCSTVYIYKALQNNGDDFSFSTFDIGERAEFTEAMRLFNIPLKITCGDALKTVPEYITSNNLEGKIDLCFVDADHSYEFAKRYTEEIFPLLGNSCVIVIHDMYYSPANFGLPFDHYAPIDPEDITGNPASVGEARAVREYFLQRNDYVLFSSHRLFGGIGDCSPIVPLNVSLIGQLDIHSLYNLEVGRFWNMPPMLLIAVPRSILNHQITLP